MPDKAPLMAKVTGVINQKRYRIEKVIYQSFKDHHITANLYIPAGKGKKESKNSRNQKEKEQN